MTRDSQATVESAAGMLSGVKPLSARQQVINLRKSARDRLARRLKK